ncbi:MAG: hypothetical protein P8126_08830 [Gammaproteobacteria bacterium]|jgi:hypothetical protein
MDQLLSLLSGLKLGLATGAIYDLVKINGGNATNLYDLTYAIQDQLNMHGVTGDANTVVGALARHGYLTAPEPDPGKAVNA